VRIPSLAALRCACCQTRVHSRRLNDVIPAFGRSREKTETSNFRRPFLTGVQAWRKLKSAGPTRGGIGETNVPFARVRALGGGAAAGTGHWGEPPCGFDCRSAYTVRSSLPGSQHRPRDWELPRNRRDCRICAHTPAGLVELKSWRSRETAPSAVMIRGDGYRGDANRQRTASCRPGRAGSC
jgi:hypothetical protein